MIIACGFESEFDQDAQNLLRIMSRHSMRFGHIFKNNVIHHIETVCRQYYSMNNHLIY